MVSHTRDSWWPDSPGPVRNSGALRSRRRPGIRECVDFIRRHPESRLVEKAAHRVARILARRFPSERFESNFTPGELEKQLLLAIRNGRPLVAAFGRRQDGPQDAWTWQVSLVEIAGVAARIDDLVPTIHTPDQGTFRASGGALKGPLAIEPLGEAGHTWSCRGALWRGSRVTLTFVGSYGAKQTYLRVRPLGLFLD